MKHKYECVEGTVDFETWGFKIRLWVNADDIFEDSSSVDNNDTIHSKAEAIEHMIDVYIRQAPRNIEEVAEYGANIPGVNAIQVKTAVENERETQYGIMIYTVPFDRKEKT